MEHLVDNLLFYYRVSRFCAVGRNWLYVKWLKGVKDTWCKRCSILACLALRIWLCRPVDKSTSRT
jgi:hypothetical protein